MGFTRLNEKCLHFSKTSKFAPEVTKKRNEKFIPEDRWCRFYRFPYINQARLLNRFKLYQTTITVISAPISIGLYMNNVVSVNNCFYMIGLASLACGMLYVMGNIFSKLIGIMDINIEGDTIRVSHLTFFGAKKQFILPVDTVIPFSEYEFNPHDILLKFKRYDRQEELFFIIKYGGVTDKDAFVKVFGNPIVK